MPIFKSKVADKFVTLPNETIQDMALSWEARGLLAFMLSLPADWTIHKQWLSEQCAMCGRDKLNRILDELVDNGYLVKQQSRSDFGQFTTNDFFVYSERQETVNGNAVDGKPVNGKPAATKETVLQKKQDTKEKSLKDLVPSVKNASTPAQHEPLSGFFLLLKNGDEFGLTVKQVRSWADTYKNVNVNSEIAIMVEWCKANPAKRKTKAGILRFCNAWLSRADKQPKRQDWDAAATDTSWAQDIGGW